METISFISIFLLILLLFLCPNSGFCYSFNSILLISYQTQSLGFEIKDLQFNGSLFGTEAWALNITSWNRNSPTSVCDNTTILGGPRVFEPNGGFNSNLWQSSSSWHDLPLIDIDMILTSCKAVSGPWPSPFEPLYSQKIVVKLILLNVFL